MCRNQLQPQSGGEKIRGGGGGGLGQGGGGGGGEEREKPPSSPLMGLREYRPRIQQQIARLRIVVLGAEGVGKSALTVRYLTRRYISEYRKAIDLLYRHTVCLDDVTSEVEILDVSIREQEGEGITSAHTRWGEGFAVVYSIDDASSFQEAAAILDSLQRLKAPVYVPVILLANKRDLDSGRQVSVEDGQALSLQHGCQFYEVSAAESHVGVTLAFQALLRETRSLQLTRPLPRQRRISIVAVSRMIGSLIGRGGSDPPSPPLRPTVIVQEPFSKRALRRKDKKRPSLSL